MNGPLLLGGFLLPQPSAPTEPPPSPRPSQAELVAAYEQDCREHRPDRMLGLVLLASGGAALAGVVAGVAVVVQAVAR